jgi:anthranilate synthase/indole-3-glycerol phosphate synthase/phosphoribosylanthranilate isomerase
MLTDTSLSSLIEYSRSLGMEPLVEVASVSEMKRALALNSQVIGVNNRDLNTFTVDMNRTTALSGMVSENIILLALSGIKNRKDVEGYLNNGVKGVLVGESLMKSNDKIQAVRDLITNPKKIENNLKAEIVLKPKKTMVKICGLTNILDAKAAVSHGADLLGFIFARNSPRYVDKETVKQIINTIQPNAGHIHHLFSNSFLTPPASAKEWFSSQNLPSKRPLFIGVFTCQSAHEINQITAECNLDLIQLHTPRSPSFHRLLNRPVVQVLGISTSTTLTNLETFAKQCAGSCTALLLDTTTPQVVGGSGETFDWALATKLNLPVWLAGGLKPENVKESCRIGNPLVVDVCSGVELDGKKGQKDIDKLKRFIQAVDSWDQSL